jgi:tetratricopeptide (TPR) repeat protein
MESRNWDAAMLDCTAALQVDEKSNRALVARGMVYNGKGEYDNAIKDFDVVTEVTGREPEKLRDRADAYAERSHSLYQQGKYLEAIDSAYFATLEKSDHIGAHLNRASGLYRSARVRQSCEQFKSCHQCGRKIG